VKVDDPDGQTWRISRRWVPWRRRRWRDINPPGADLNGLATGLPDDVVGLALLVVLVLIAVLLVPLLLLPLLLVAEVVLLLLLMPFAVAGRVLLGRRWCVEVRRGWSPWMEQPAGDWGDSSVLIHEIADDIRRGVVPVRTLGVTRTTRQR
jgi:hypothetical protein